MKKQVLPLLLVLLISNANAQLSIVSNQTFSQLVSAITGSGIAVSNITGTGASASQGLFTCTGNCNIGLASGIILTSGDANVAAQPNTGTGQGFGYYTMVGNTQLGSIATAAIYDVSLLQFDFIAASDSVHFNYIFASEEYNDFVNTAFNDVFGFFISGPGINGFQNIALIPGTSLPVSINNVNNGGPVAHLVPPSGPCMNCQYFINNAPGNTTTAYDALTTVLKAAVGGLTPGMTYNLIIGICDVNDGIYDSGVFIEAGSFVSANPAWVYTGGNPITGNQVEICAGNQIELSAPNGFTYLWSNGSTSQSIFVSQPGQYSVTLTGSNQQASVSSNLIYVVTSASSISAPVINQNGNLLTCSVTQPGMTYSWTKDGNPIPSANSSSITISQNACYAVTVKDNSGCVASSNPLCTGPLGLPDNNPYEGFSISPNPVSGSAWIILPASDKPYQVVISDLHGRVVLNESAIKSGRHELKSENLAGGIYSGEIKHPDNGNYHFRFIKE